MDQHDNQYVENDMTHNYAHGPSKFDHLIFQNNTSKGNTSYTCKITCHAIMPKVVLVVYHKYT
jgi:hypothetical protein